MFDYQLLFLFSLAVFTLMITPGTDMVYVISNTLSKGTSAGIASILGVASGAYLHVIMATLGLAALVAASTTAYNAIVIVGAIYMAWIGWNIFKDDGLITADYHNSVQKRLNTIYIQGVMTNLLNPKAIIFTIAFFPQFISTEAGNISQQMLFLGVILVIIMILVELPLVFFATKIREKLIKDHKMAKRIHQICGSTLMLLAIYITASRIIM